METLTKEYQPQTIELDRGEYLDLRGAVEQVKTQGIVRYVIKDHAAIDEQVEVIRKAQETADELEHQLPTEGYPSQGQTLSRNLNALWRLIAGSSTGFMAVGGLVNVYKEDDVFGKHCDLHEAPKSEYSPEESLSFLYVADGAKKILFYLDGKDGPATEIQQSPGELYVFQGGGVAYPDGTEKYGLFHEVPPQGVTGSVTINWELYPDPSS